MNLSTSRVTARSFPLGVNKLQKKLKFVIETQSHLRILRQTHFFMKKTPTLVETRSQSVTPLSVARAGKSLLVRTLHGAESTCQRLREMGFCESAVVRKLTDGKNFICTVCGTRIALSLEMASHILVSPENKAA